MEVEPAAATIYATASTSNTSNNHKDNQGFSRDTDSEGHESDRTLFAERKNTVLSSHGTPAVDISTPGSSSSNSPAVAFKTSRSQNALSFKRRQEQYFAEILWRKWNCKTPGHILCVPTRDGRHRQFSEHDVAAWVKSLCLGETTTAQPPEVILSSPCNETPIFPGGGDWSLIGKAVSIPPSRRPGSYRSPRLLGSGSFTDSSSSGVPGPGYHSGRALKWLGEKGLDVLQDATILKRAVHYRALLKGWEKPDGTEVGLEKLKKLFQILGEALEMSRTCYSPRVNKSAYKIGRAVHWWLDSYPGITLTKENASWLVQIQICLLPLLLVQIANDDPLAGDMAWDLMEVLQKVPLILQDSTDTAAVIQIIAKELTYSPYSFRHSWLGVDFRRIVQTMLQIRPLMAEELDAIRDLAVRRLEQKTCIGPRLCRPWEVAIFAECASQDVWFMEVVLGDHGLQSLLSALDDVLSEPVLDRDDQWEHLALILRSLAFLSEHAWIANAVDSGIIGVLLNIFGRNIPERWFCIRFWAIDIIRSIVSHCRPLFRILVQENAAPALSSLISAPISRGSSRVSEDYRKAAKHHAKELLDDMRKWIVDSRGGPRGHDSI